MNLKDQLISLEGWKNAAYPDPLTHGAPWTIGVGHTGPDVYEDSVWTNAQVEAALDADIAKAAQGCKDSLPWFDQLNEPRQGVLIGMAFQMGLHGLLGFVNMLACAKVGRFSDAAEHMKNSMWAHQTPKRAAILAQQFATGLWPDQE